MDLEAALAAQLAGMKVLYDLFREVLPRHTSEELSRLAIQRLAQHDPPILLGFPHEFKDE
jgi:predicted SnoaL-like aldol condensation-catalyzing enzyme